MSLLLRAEEDAFPTVDLALTQLAFFVSHVARHGVLDLVRRRSSFERLHTTKVRDEVGQSASSHNAADPRSWKERGRRRPSGRPARRQVLYHLPLYRQHQRLAAADVRLARSTLTGWVHRVGDLLEPIYQAQLRSILASEVLAMDETPIKAGRKERGPNERGAMKIAYFWPIYGDQDEIAFPFADTRGSVVVREALKEYVGVLLSDGYGVYDRYTKSVDRVEHAQCWSHTRRHLLEAEPSEPRWVKEALDLIAALYREEAVIRSKGFSPEQALAHRGEHSKPIVDRLFEGLRRALREEILLPTNPFTKAAHYALERESALRVFLGNPAVPLDTNHLERAIRPIAVGRRNWLFCWTEVGAKYVGIFQSLLSTCRVQRIDPYVYLVHVLQRIDTHPASEVEALTPRLWKEKFAAAPMRSDLDRNPLVRAS